MPAPCTPGTSFYADKRKQNPPGRPRSPYLCATMGTLGKSLVGVLAHLRLIHASSERFFRWRGCPRGAARSPLFKIPPPRQRGIFKGGRTSPVSRVVRPLLNALLVKAFSHKKPCAGCRGAQRPAKPGGASAHKPRFR